MRLRIAITIITLCLYLGSINLYIFEFLNWSVFKGKLFYNTTTLIAMAFALADLKAGFVNRLHKDMNLLIFLCILTNYIFIILTLVEILHRNKPFLMFYSFNGTILAFTITIFFNELKYGLFRD